MVGRTAPETFLRGMGKKKEGRETISPGVTEPVMTFKNVEVGNGSREIGSRHRGVYQIHADFGGTGR